VSARTAAAVAAAASAVLLAVHGDGAAADVSLPPVTIGAGIQTGFYDCDKACLYSPGTVPAGDSSVAGFAIDSIRLYVNGTVTDQIKLTFDTEYTGSGSGPGDDKVVVLDAIGRFEFNDHINIWAGRFVEPSDRDNLSGPYYVNDWTPFADGVADDYPGIENGRDNGVAYWGDFGIAKIQLGAFDGESLNGSTAVKDPSKILYAGRLTLDFWDKETGYYFNGTYYGDKDLLALGLVAQSLDSKSAWDVDGIMEKKLAEAGTVTVSAEYQKDNGLTSNAYNNASSDGWFAEASYLFPQVVGVGKFQLLGRYSHKTYDASALMQSNQVRTTEVDVNYIIKAFNVRLGLYYLTQTDSLPSTLTPTEVGLKLQLQM
jgi:hypothetical protein